MKNRSAWIFVLAATSLWHFSRGAYGDALVFGVGAALLECDHRGIHKLLPNRIQISRSQLTIVIALAWVTLTITHRYGWIDITVLYAIGALAFVSAWHPDFGRRTKSSKPANNAAKLWSAIALVVCVTELTAYIFATRTKDDYSYPTLTVLLDPSLDHMLGRGIFSAVWLAVGLRLIRPKVTES